MKYLLPIFYLTIYVCHAAAQDAKFHRSVLGGYVGLNFPLMLVNGSPDFRVNMKDRNETIYYSGLVVKATPTLQLSYDYAPSKWLSMGFAFGYNDFHLNFTGLDYTGYANDAINSISGDGSIIMERFSCNLRIMGHYLNNEKFDIYSGVRFGFSIWRNRMTGNFISEGGVNELPDKIKKRPGLCNAGLHPQSAFTVVGFRWYLHEYFGVGCELNAGSPYYLSSGINMRF